MLVHIMIVFLFQFIQIVAYLTITSVLLISYYRKLPLPSKSKQHGVVPELKSISTKPVSLLPVCAIVVGSATLGTKLAV
jgi:hypothetical protein